MQADSRSCILLCVLLEIVLMHENECLIEVTEANVATPQSAHIDTPYSLMYYAIFRFPPLQQ